MSGFLVNKGLLDPTVTQYAGGTATFTLPQSGSTNSTEVFVGGVPQIAGVDFNVAGTTLTLTTSAPAGSNFVCARQYFSDGITGTAGANTVATSAIQNDAVNTVKILNDSVTGSKLNPALVAGDIIYADGTDTINRLAKGSALQTLQMNAGATAPNWVTAAGGAWEFVSTQTASTSSSIDFTNMASGYDYEYWTENMQNNTFNAGWQSLLGIAGPTYRTSSYHGGIHRANYHESEDQEYSTTLMLNTTVVGMGESAGEGLGSSRMTLINPAASGTKTCWDVKASYWHDTGSMSLGSWGGGRYETAEAHTSIRFQPSSGTVDGGIINQYRRTRS